MSTPSKKQSSKKKGKKSIPKKSQDDVATAAAGSGEQMKKELYASYNNKQKFFSLKYPSPSSSEDTNCSMEEYENLLKEASGLTKVEAQTEIYDCARYGELNVIRAILSAHSKKVDNNDNNNSGESLTSEQKQIIQELLNYQDEKTGNTCLHMSCANGHFDLVRFLLEYNCSYIMNNNKNSPLHYACSQGHVKCVELLLCHQPHPPNNGDDSYYKIDVLSKNSFGRSALTEGFGFAQNTNNNNNNSSNDDLKTRLVGLLLEHESAEEERLIGGTAAQHNDNNNNNEATDSSKAKEEEAQGGVIHDFTFLSNPQQPKQNKKSLKIRELPIEHPDDPFGASPEEDTTGLGIWCASLVMSYWIASLSSSSSSNSKNNLLKDKNLCELGAGCGIPSITSAFYGSPSQILITDLNPKTVKNIQYNIDLNNFDNTTTIIKAMEINWDDTSTYPKNAGEIDTILGSDLIYQKSIVPLLIKVITGLLGLTSSPSSEKPKSFLYVAPQHGPRDGLDIFLEQIEEIFPYKSSRVAPDEFMKNPLSSQNQDECFLHFSDLMNGTKYVLYTFSTHPILIDDEQDK